MKLVAIGDNGDVPQTSLAAAEADADALIAQLRAGTADPDRILARIRASQRPYFTWAAAWTALNALAERHPEDTDLRAALDTLRSLEPAASTLDGRSLVRGVSRDR